MCVCVCVCVCVSVHVCVHAGMYKCVCIQARGGEKRALKKLAEKTSKKLQKENLYHDAPQRISGEKSKKKKKKRKINSKQHFKIDILQNRTFRHPSVLIT